MRINVSKGSDALGLSKYVLDPSKQRDADKELGRSPILHTNMFGRNPTELAEEFRFSHDLNLRVQRTMVHFSISLPPGERVSDQKRVDISQQLLRRMGHRDCQFFVAVHHDQEHKNGVEHWHVATSAVDLGGRWVPDHFNYLALKQVERELEVAYGLQYCPPKPEGEQQNLTSGEHRLKERTGVAELPKEKLWRAIDQATMDHPSMPLLVARLKGVGVEVRFSTFDEGGKGLSFAIDGGKFQGRKLGKAYSLEGLQKHRGVSYEPERDDEMLRELNELSIDQCKEVLERLDLEWEGGEGWAITPNGVELRGETSQDVDLLKAGIREQAERVALLVREIWEWERSSKPRLKTATFDEYKVRLGEEGEPELWRGDRLLLGYTSGQYHTYGLSAQDCQAVEKLNELSKQQAEERQIEQEFQERQERLKGEDGSSLLVPEMETESESEPQAKRKRTIGQKKKEQLER